MRLSRLIASSKNANLLGPDVEITGLSEDSRKIRPGDLFVAVPGVKQNGNAFIDEALYKGARALLQAIGSDPVIADVSIVTTPHVRVAMAEIAATFYPKQPEIVAAVTGTSGKTSTAQFMREIWQSLGHKSASIGTLGLVTSEGTGYGSLTTPDAITLHRLLDECAGKHITHTALEASSHGIDLHRMDKIRFKAAGFTNLSRDHLDYHETMEAYLAVKTKLFSHLLPRGSTAVLNADIPEFEHLEAASRERGLNIVSYGRRGNELNLIEVRPDPAGQVLVIDAFGRRIDVLLPVLGSFQASNALCAAGLVFASGAESDAALLALHHVTGVPGRLQLVGTSPKGGIVFVDYAHKPDALENVLTAMRPHAALHRAKLAVIFGCGGNRDKGKRPIMGAIAQRLADWVIVTDDNPRHEDAVTIRQEVLAGCSDKSNVTEIGDRAKAIAAGIEKLAKGDVLIIAGKGHEPGQIVGDTILPFDDTQEARKILTP